MKPGISEGGMGMAQDNDDGEPLHGTQTLMPPG